MPVSLVIVLLQGGLCHYGEQDYPVPAAAARYYCIVSVRCAAAAAGTFPALSPQTFPLHHNTAGPALQSTPTPHQTTAVSAPAPAPALQCCSTAVLAAGSRLQNSGRCR